MLRSALLKDASNEQLEVIVSMVRRYFTRVLGQARRKIATSSGPWNRYMDEMESVLRL